MTLSEEEYLRAWKIYSNEAFVDIDDEDEWTTLKSITDQEEMYIKLERYNNLSTEARQVIDMIINPTFQSLRMLQTPHGLLTKRSIRTGLQKMWSSKYIAKKVIEELTKWVTQL